LGLDKRLAAPTHKTEPTHGRIVFYVPTQTKKLAKKILAKKFWQKNYDRVLGGNAASWWS